METPPFESPEIQVGVLLTPSPAAAGDVERYNGELDDSGHAQAWGERGRHAAPRRTVAVLGQDVLRAAAEAVGREVAVVVSGVVNGLEHPGSAGSQTGSFDIDGVDLKFGVKATIGAGKAVEALLSASSEATVEVTLTLRRRSAAGDR
ncbi:hypothetical protein [Dactylosporangium siamense]|uniref:Uncharacterized protein n=1 Tax=Dactylosporangium siamense TaxID=685454 RepID=A0A919U6U7_9ACTN|nr:hypothetical protein [Dactylosporangium siamense]GIG43857.1 hypothetical protein Dsi01nite_018980 [Dactylosporangium siamense]